MKLAQATGACAVFERQMIGAKNVPDMLRFYDNGVKVLRGLEPDLEKSAAAGLFQRLLAVRDRLHADLRALAPAPSWADKPVISPQQLDQLEQMMLQASVGPSELMAVFGLQRLTAMPAEAYGSARAWLFECGESRRGVTVIEPVVSAPAEIEPVRSKLDKQRLVDDEAKRRGIMAPLLDMPDDLPWEEGSV